MIDAGDGPPPSGDPTGVATSNDRVVTSFLPGWLITTEHSRRTQSFLLLVARVCASAMAVATPLVLVRLLTQDAFGHYKQIFLVAGTILQVLPLGLPGSLFYFLPRFPGLGRAYLAQSTAALLLLGAGAGAMVLVSGPFLATLFEAPLTQYTPTLALYVALALPSSVLPVVLTVDRRTRLAATTIALSDIVKTGAIVGVVLFGGHLTGILLVVSVVAAGQLLGLGAYLARRPGRLAASSLGASVRAQLGYAIPFWMATWVETLRDTLPAYWVASHASSATFAVYAVGTTALPFVDQVSTSVADVVILSLAGALSANQASTARHLWHRATMLLFFVSIPTFVILEVFARDVIVSVFGAPYADATPIFRVYLLTLPLGAILASAVLRATADSRTILRADLLSLLASSAALVLLWPLLGPVAAAVSLVVSLVVFDVLAVSRTMTRLDLSTATFLPWRLLLRIFLISIAAALLASWGSSGIRPLARVAIGVPLAFAITAVVSWVLNLVPSPERLFVANLATRVVTRLSLRGSP